MVGCAQHLHTRCQEQESRPVAGQRRTQCLVLETVTGYCAGVVVQALSTGGEQKVAVYDLVGGLEAQILDLRFPQMDVDSTVIVCHSV